MNSVVGLTPSERAELFNAAAQKLGIGPVALEKDFWVCWTLRELFSLPGIGEHLIFKGGTSLSKVWAAISRFSEDIDVSLSKEWLGFGGESDPERQKSRKQRSRKLDELTGACARKINEELLPALHARATIGLAGRDWSLIVSPDTQSPVRFGPSLQA